MIADQQVFLVPLTRDLRAQGEASSDINNSATGDP